MTEKTKAIQANSLGVPEKTETAANDDMFEGYMDGFDPANPEPSANRSHSYRHGFVNGRADRAGKPSFGSATEAREFAAIAMQKDASA